jgi:DNA invertase Pin-like site-specific DNA recombinase
MDGKRVGLYLRVSTDDQTVENQRQALVEAAAHRKWRIVEEFVDNGISGAKGREKRPGFDRLLKAVVRREIDVVAAWSVDRLGRSLQHLVSFLEELDGAGCDLYVFQHPIGTPSSMRSKALILLGE